MTNETPDWVKEYHRKNASLEAALAVTLEEYQSAVKHLVGLARSDTGGSAPAAQVVLSLYNGHNWHVDLTDLGSLDYEYLTSALIAIRGRLLLQTEPHDVIPDGPDIFAALQEQWAHLHTSRRYSKK